ncbi:MAG: glycerophosphodiester phosphodiesterase [Armatimonadota bacterium]
MKHSLVVALAAAAALPALAQDNPTAPVRRQAGPRRVVIAHRGASGYLPEHTLPAAAMAYQMGADYIEPDCVLSKDGVPVVVHDIHIDTVSDVARKFPDRKRADGRYYALDFTVAELKTLAVSERFDPKTGEAAYPKRFPLGVPGFQIPTLEEEIQLVQGLNKSKGRNVGIYPEVKNPAWHRGEGRDISKVVLDVLRKYGYRTKSDNCYVQCFDWDETQRIRKELGWEGRLIQLTTVNSDMESPTDYDKLLTDAGLDDVAKVCDGIGPWIAQIVEGRVDGKLKANDLVERAHARKLLVHPYTFRADAVQTWAKDFDELVTIAFTELKVDGIFSDHADKAVAVVRRLRTARPARQAAPKADPSVKPPFSP